MKTLPAMLALVGDAFGGRGGIAQYNRDFLGILAQCEAVSSITIVPRLAPESYSLPARIDQTSARSGRILYTVNALATAVARNVDIVFCGHLFMSPLARQIARLKRAKLIIQVHGIEAWPEPSVLQRGSLEAADLLLCVSRYTRSVVLSWASFAPDRAVVLSNTVRNVFTPGDASELRSELGLQRKRVLLTVARLDSQDGYKGHDRVIALLPRLIEQGLDLAYVVVGDGHDRSRLEALAHQTVGAERVRFLGGVGLHRLVQAYRMADLFILPSSGEGFGIVFLEAMACGTPSLGVQLGGATDALADGELGTAVPESELFTTMVRLLVEPKPDPDALSAAVRLRFGREVFAAGACAALKRLTAPSYSDGDLPEFSGVSKEQPLSTAPNH